MPVIAESTVIKSAAAAIVPAAIVVVRVVLPYKVL